MPIRATRGLLPEVISPADIDAVVFDMGGVFIIPDPALADLFR